MTAATVDGAQVRITFRDGVPVWSAHLAVHGQELFLDLAAGLAATSGPGADFPVQLAGGPFGALWGKACGKQGDAAADKG